MPTVLLIGVQISMLQVCSRWVQCLTEVVPATFCTVPQLPVCLFSCAIFTEKSGSVPGTSEWKPFSEAEEIQKNFDKRDKKKHR
jgi:hypothetical protein